ncbi:hypothetical protein DFH09DRAFT_1301012 [Mycena vulgaris]|nr:hypothetical protein DFH09DRAFT_1301012 [Mycena vulgaris]
MPSAPQKLSAHASRNPLEPVQQPRKRASKKSTRGLSDAAKATRAAANEQRSRDELALEEAFAEIFTQREEDIANLAEKYKKSAKYIRQVLENSVKYTEKRAPSLKNAITHDLSKKARENGEASNVRDVELKGEEYQAYKDSLSEEEKARLIAQLVEDKGIKLHGVRATNKAAAMDAMQNSNQFGKVAINLHARTGVRAFSMFSRGHPDDAAMPCFVDSDNARQFFQDVLDVSAYDLVRKFELWCCNQDKPVKQGKEKAALCKFISDTVEEGLRKATGNKTLTMAWLNYKIDIVHKHGVELAGWPTKVTMARPSKLRGEDVRLIVDRLRNGTMRWVGLTKSQRDEVAAEVEKLRDSGATKPRQERSDKNKPRGPRARKVVRDDSDTDSSSDNDDESDKDDDAEEPAPVAPNLAPVAPTLTPTLAPVVPTLVAARPTARAQSPAPFVGAVEFGSAPLTQDAAAFPSAAPISSRPELSYNEGLDYLDFMAMDLNMAPPFVSQPSNSTDDFNGSNWHLNTSNREDEWMDASGSNTLSASFNGSGGTSFNFDAVDFSAINFGADFHGGTPYTQAAAGYTQSTSVAYPPASALVYAQDTALITTGARPAAAAAGPTMSVFSVATNTTVPKKRKRAKDTGADEVPTRKPRGSKKKDADANAGVDAGGDAQPKHKRQKKSAPAAAPEV